MFFFDGKCLRVVEVSCLFILEGEFNKLVVNILIGCDWVGVYYYSDYCELLLMGEEIVMGIL